MNHLEFGSVAIGAPGSEARNKAEQADRLAAFLLEYGKQLTIARRDYPAEYVWPESETQAVYNRMASAIERGSFNKDSRAIKATCKRFGIAHTYKAINEFLMRKEA